jgi:hypothetical protein
MCQAHSARLIKDGGRLIKDGGKVKTMARSQTWTRNISKKEKRPRTHGATRPAKSIVDGGALENLKRRAEDLGLIVHARPTKARGKKRDGVK